MSGSKVKKLARLVIIGTGWSSYSVLRNVDKNKFQVIVISKRNHFLFTPLLCSTTVGTLEFRSIIEPVRHDAHFRSSADFHQSDVVHIDTASRKLHCRSIINKLQYQVPYDLAVIGVGAVANTFNVAGVVEHGHFLKEVQDARSIRNQVLTNFELACLPDVTVEDLKRLLHVVIVGGGPTGVEFAAELYDFLQHDVTRYFADLRQYCQVSLVESDHILASFDKSLTKGVQLLKDSVVEVGPDHVKLASGRRLACGLTVWSAGLQPSKLVRRLDGFLKNDKGQLITDDHLRVLGSDKTVGDGRLFAIGDCSAMENLDLPATAQVAERQGRYLGRILPSYIRTDGSELESAEKIAPFSFKSAGMLAYIGGYQGVSDLPGAKLSGYSSWFIWRSAYLTQLGSWRLRMQVPIDWLKTFLFGRDISRF